MAPVNCLFIMTVNAGHPPYQLYIQSKKKKKSVGQDLITFKCGFSNTSTTDMKC